MDSTEIEIASSYGLNVDFDIKEIRHYDGVYTASDNG